MTRNCERSWRGGSPTLRAPAADANSFALPLVVKVHARWPDGSWRTSHGCFSYFLGMCCCQSPDFASGIELAAFDFLRSLRSGTLQLWGWLSSCGKAEEDGEAGDLGDLGSPWLRPPRPPRASSEDRLLG